VVICHLTSLVHLIPTKQTYRAKDIAEVIFDRVYKHHGMPRNIVSDRDTLFTSTFWRRLHELTGTELRMSSAYHPQSDGATERANRTMTQMVRQCVSPDQRDWAAKLPAIEFAMNSACSQTTGFPPFVLNYGRMPQSMVWNNNSEYPGVRKFAQKMKDAILTAHDAILAARVKQTRLANNRRKEAPFSVGDMVYLSTTNLTLPKGRARKLAPKFIGPYRILEEYKNNSFKLDLPSELKQRGLHPSFHANLLRIHVPNDDRRFPGRQMSQITALGNSEEWAVSSVETHHGKGTGALFELIWKTGDRAWLPYHEVSHLEALNQYLESQGVSKISELPRRISKDENLPIISISPANDITLRNLVADIIEDTDKFGARNSKTGTCSDKHGEKVYKGCTSRAHSRVPCNTMLNTEEHFKRFYDFADLLKSGQYDPARHPMPPGYIEYCVLVQHDPEECVPFPPGISLNTVTVNGHEVRTLATPAPNEEAVLAQNEPAYNSRRDQAGQLRREPDARSPRRRGPIRRRGRDAGDGQRAVRALINAFEAETDWSKPEEAFPRSRVSNKPTERERLRESRAQDNRETRLSRTPYDRDTPRRETRSTNPAPQRERRFGNHVLDNRSKALAPKAAITDNQNASAGPSGLTYEQKSSESVPAPVSAADVPLPASPSPEAPMDVDNGSSASKGKGTQLDLLFVLTVANFILLLVQMLRSNPPCGLGGRM
jgi:hypothetical protein